MKIQKEHTFLFTGLKITGIILVFISAYLSVGIHHYDEYFQIIEFANYKNGGVDSSLLPWEFKAEMRSGIQPLIAFFVLKILAFFNSSNPFILLLLLRLLTAVFTCYVSVKAFNYLSPKLNSNVSKLFLILSLFFLWFMPYIMVRFSSETIGGYVFVLAILLIFEAKEKPQTFKWILSGMFLVIAFYLRYQIGAAIFGLFCWMVICREKVRLKSIMWLVVGIVFGSIISLVCDYWMYGDWVLSPLNYFTQNLMEGKAASFGVSPWWSYFRMFFKQSGVPLAILCVLLLVIGLFKGRKSVFTWIFIPFLILHMFVGHKELRFLFPVILPFIFLMVIGFDYLVGKSQRPGILQWVLIMVFLINIPALIFRVMVPADEKMKQISYLSELNKAMPISVITINEGLFSYGMLRTHFLVDNTIDSRVVNSVSDLPKEIDKLERNRPVYILFKGKSADEFEQNSDYLKVNSGYLRIDPPFDLYGWIEKNPHYYLFKVQ